MVAYFMKELTYNLLGNKLSPFRYARLTENEFFLAGQARVPVRNICCLSSCPSDDSKGRFEAAISRPGPYLRVIYKDNEKLNNISFQSSECRQWFEAFEKLGIITDDPLQLRSKDQSEERWWKKVDVGLMWVRAAALIAMVVLLVVMLLRTVYQQ
jgi:hypothetical protein